MAKIWFCRTCGYEVPARGRCHACGGRLEKSPLSELASAADEGDEVGYNLEHWDGEARGRLIVALIEAGVEHRFEDEELVVATEDEERTDDLVAAIRSGADQAGDAIAGDGAGGEGPASVEHAPDQDSAALLAEVDLLRDAAHRLQADPTDMHADGDVAQASAAVFAADGFFAADPDTWAAVGRVTRRLLVALGADEALEDQIRAQAAVLVRLLDPLFSGGQQRRADIGAADPADAEPDLPDEETVYELPEWLPEQRAELSLLLEEQHIPHRWLYGDLVVAASHEAEAEALFERVEGEGEVLEGDDEDDEARYRALEELFAAADRFVNDPNNKTRAAEVVRAVEEADGPTPVGLDDAQWWTIRTRARSLADAIEHGGNRDVTVGEASTLRDLLRALV